MEAVENSCGILNAILCHRLASFVRMILIFATLNGV